MAKKKIVKLTDEQYFEYIMSLKNEPAFYNADGEMQIPDTIKNTDEDKKSE